MDSVVKKRSDTDCSENVPFLRNVQGIFGSLGILAKNVDSFSGRIEGISIGMRDEM